MSVIASVDNSNQNKKQTDCYKCRVKLEPVHTAEFAEVQKTPKMKIAIVLTAIVALCCAQQCPPGEVVCTGSTECVKEELVCDGNSTDCANGADEADCPCGPRLIPCPGNNPLKQCIYRSWLCDGLLDCWDGSDEKGYACETGFECDTGVCIPLTMTCDFEKDCCHGEDEIKAECPPCEGMLCDDGFCIRKEWVCDGQKDCSNGEDEVDCPPCRGFTCNDGNCIVGSFQCDGDPDCPEGEDEIGCICDGFSCSDGHCISQSKVCNAVNDCHDGADERNCTCNDNEIYCPNTGEFVVCIPPYFICDLVQDCPDGSDEVNCNYTMTAIPDRLNYSQRHSALLSHGDVVLQSKLPSSTNRTNEQKHGRNLNNKGARKAFGQCF